LKGNSAQTPLSFSKLFDHNIKRLHTQAQKQPEANLEPKWQPSWGVALHWCNRFYIPLATMPLGR